MKVFPMFRIRFGLPLFVFAVLSGTSHAGWFCQSGDCKPACECEVVWGCCPSYEKVKVEKSGFEVECEQICVPKVRLPWADPCEPRCAFVVSVNKLKKAKKDDGEKCVLKWEAKPFCSQCRKPAAGFCPSVSCAPVCE